MPQSLLIQPIALCLAAAGWLFYSLWAQAACSTITGSGVTKTCAFSGNLTGGITTSSVTSSADDSAIITVKPGTNLGSVTLDRTILTSLSTLDITTGGYYMLGELALNSPASSFPPADKNSPDGRDGRALTLNFSNARAQPAGSAARAFDLSEVAPNGYNWACQITGAQCDKLGGRGGDGAKFTVNAAGSISSTADRSFNLYSQGGYGGDASVPFGLLGSGPSGGSGGAGGAVSFLTSAALSINSGAGYSMVLESLGGSGGHGAEGYGGGQGGTGGQGGALTVDTRSGTLSTATNAAGQVGLYTGGGSGGTGGNNSLNKGKPGGGGAAGGNITMNIDKRLSISDSSSGVAAISLQTVGGNGGRGGIGSESVLANDGGAGGNGGQINITLTDYSPTTPAILPTTPALVINTIGQQTPGLEASSGAGLGGDAGVWGGKGNGGAGGGGGYVGFDAPGSAVQITTNGSFSRGLSLFNMGANGGLGSDGTFWKRVPGSGGNAGMSQEVNLNLGYIDPTIENRLAVARSTITTHGTDSAAIFLESAGGGKGGDSGDAFSSGAMVTAGSGGDGGTVEANIGSTVELWTNGVDSPGIAALSVGGSGGSGGNRLAFWSSTGGAGAIGGQGGVVYVHSEGEMNTYGVASAGIRAQSIGGSGGNGGGTDAVGLAVGGNGGAGGAGGNVTVTNSGTIYARGGDGTPTDPTYINAPCVGGCAYGILAQSIGGTGGIAGSASSRKVALGGGGSQIKSDGGIVTVSQSGSITTEQEASDGIFAQSLGGGGGIAGATAASGLGFAIALGGDAGMGGDGGAVTVALLNEKSSITTTGSASAGIKATAIGGGGGSGGITTAGSRSTLLGVSVGVGGSGGTGGDGAVVTVESQIDQDYLDQGVSGIDVDISTNGDSSPGIDAASVGGGGGDSLITRASQTMLSFEGAGVAVSVAVGGSGGTGGSGGDVTVSLPQAKLTVTTEGADSPGIRAQSLGDGGGVAGMTVGVALASSDGYTMSVPVSVGGSGGNGGTSGNVTVTTLQGSSITTNGVDSYGIYASTGSGGGGNAKAVIDWGVALGGKNAVDVPVAVGACAGKTDSCAAHSGNSGNATVTNGAVVVTAGAGADGIYAESKTGGGGNASAVSTGSIAAGSDPGFSAPVAVGGRGGTSGASGNVLVTNSADVTVTGAGARGIVARSTTGGGGSGSSATTFSGTLNAVPLSVAVGGSGGTSGSAGSVTVLNSGSIYTGSGVATDIVDGGVPPIRQNEYGIYASSITHGGGDGGATSSTTLDFLGTTGDSSQYNATATVDVGGSGGSAARAGDVTVTNGVDKASDGTVVRTGSIETLSMYSDGIHAESIGGGGGIGGAAINTVYANSLVGNAQMVGVNLAVGGKGGSGNVGGTVTVNNDGTITTGGTNSQGIFAQSLGGGGGTGGATGSVFLASLCGVMADCAKAGHSIALAAQVGGNGGTGNDGGAVTISNTGTITTWGDYSAGVFGRSIGGGGGTGGATGEEPDWDFTLKYLGIPVSDAIEMAYLAGELSHKVASALQLRVSVGGNGKGGGNGGAVTAEVTDGLITTAGSASYGVQVVSIGGGGGDGGTGVGGLMTIATVGGVGGAAGDGGNVTATLGRSAVITTSGANAHGIYAQSVGGGGGAGGDAPLSEVVSDFQDFLSSVSGGKVGSLLDWDWASEGVGLGYSVGGNPGGGGHGGVVTVTSDGKITTTGDGSYGIFAQGIGGGGGATGLSAAGLLNVLSASGDVYPWSTDPIDPSELSFAPGDAVQMYYGSSYGWGSAGIVTITSTDSITTSGAYAHGIFAQSAAGYTASDDTRAQSVGGTVVIDVYDVAVTGSGSVAVLAQSVGGNGNGDINITTRGTISSLPGAATVQLMDGKINTLTNKVSGTISCDIQGGADCIAIQTTHGTDPITIENSNSAGLCSGGACALPDATGKCDGAACPVPDVVAITIAPQAPLSFTLTNEGEIYGNIALSEVSEVATASDDPASPPPRGNRVVNQTTGVITGAVDLGPTCLEQPSAVDFVCSFDNYGTWNPNLSSTVSKSVVGYHSLRNYGVINISQLTTVEGALTQYDSGELVFNLNSTYLEDFALSVTGVAQIAGTIRFSTWDTLDNKAYRLVQADSLAWTGRLISTTLFAWTASTLEGELFATPTAQFNAVAGSFGPNQQNLARHLETAWSTSSETHLGELFAALSRITGADEFQQLLNDLGGSGLLQADRAVREVMPGLLADVLDCPVKGSADVVLGEASCLWLGGGHSWGHYSPDGGSPNGNLDGDLYALGGQKEFRPGWFLAASVGRLDSEIQEDRFHSSGETDLFSIAVKRRSGRWEFGTSAAYGSGSFDSWRLLRIPGALEHAIRDEADVDVLAFRARGSYEFSTNEHWYLRPSLAVDIVRSETGRIRENSSSVVALDLKGPASTDVALTPGIQIGGFTRLGHAVLRGYVDAGIRYAPDAGGELEGRLAGVQATDNRFSTSLDTPDTTGLLRVGAQLISSNRLDLRLEYELEENGAYRRQATTARLAWNF